MKAKFVYNMEDEDERLAVNRVLKSLDMASVLFEIQNNLKKKCEWESESLEADSDKYDGLEVAFRRIYELFDAHKINTEELIR